MATTTFVARDLMSGANLGLLPFVGSYSQQHNGAGAILGRIEPDGDPAVTQGYLDATVPRRTVMWVARDRTLIDGYIIWSRQWDRAGGRILLTGGSLWSYFQRRRLRETRAYNDVDQLAIAEDLIDYAQSQPGGDIGIVTPSNTSGVLRDRNPIGYQYELKYISVLVEQLADVINGFDFAIECAFDTAELPTATFRTYYPRRGRSADANGIKFTFGVNLLDLDFAEVENDRPNTMLGIGAGEDITQLEAPAIDTSEIDAGYPLLEASYIRKNIYEQNTLEENAAGALRRAQDSDRLTIYVDPDHPGARFGSWVVGDDVAVSIEAGRHPRFPLGLERTMRILGQTITPHPDGGPDSVALMLGAARG